MLSGRGTEGRTTARPSRPRRTARYSFEATCLPRSNVDCRRTSGQYIELDAGRSQTVLRCTIDHRRGRLHQVVHDHCSLVPDRPRDVVTVEIPFDADLLDRLMEAADEELAIGTEQGFPLWRALGTLHIGSAMLLQGRQVEAIPMLLKGLSQFRATGAEIRIPCYLGIVGHALTQDGRFGEAHEALDEALAVADKNDDRTHEAELHRLKGELNLAETSNQTAAQECFRVAIETARRQGSRAWQLRATTSLARLWQQQDRNAEAYKELAAVYGTYTEGFTTRDLIEARALLEELARSA